MSSACKNEGIVLSVLKKVGIVGAGVNECRAHLLEKAQGFPDNRRLWMAFPTLYTILWDEQLH